MLGLLSLLVLLALFRVFVDSAPFLYTNRVLRFKEKISIEDRL